MSSSPDTKPRTTGAHRTHRTHREARDRAAARTLAQQPLAHYEPYLDGLFTYCLSVLCDHDAAIAALGDALVSAERRGQRAPGAADERRAWLYALARWACLRELAETRRNKQNKQNKQKRRGTHTAAGRDGTRHGRVRPAASPVPDEVQRERRRELTLLAWPEAAGTTPEQREALELAVRHRLAVHEVAAVLGRSTAATRELLAAAACEVERTRAALAVVESGACPSISRLTGDDQVVLSATLRRELVRHVDDCPRCRRAAGRALPGRWPGATVTPSELPLLTAPRAALCTALAHHPRARGAGPRFDRRGFPLSPKDHAARRDRLRARAVTTTVVATVVAAPVLALWTAYRDAPAGGGERHGGPSATAREAHDLAAPDSGPAGGGYQNTGNTAPGPVTRFGGGDGPDVSVEVVSVTGTGHKGREDGRLTVTASGTGGTTLITLTASGPGPVRWSASTGASWLYLSRTSGILRPGESLTIRVYVDHLREPSGPWSARVTIAPAGAIVTLHGRGVAPGSPDPGPTPPAGPPPAPGPQPAPTRSAPGSPTSPPSPPSSPADPPSSDPAPTPTGSAPPEPGGHPPVPGDGDVPSSLGPSDSP
ncbi:hypothetical protein [Streptomyces thermoalcalitolerans]|uniref:BACON domain-containing protein n=1 Tax=Streptomyces thermoalcalitolerans TaxID=65605 RepID=A0ABN1PH23_9ACTN